MAAEPVRARLGLNSEPVGDTMTERETAAAIIGSDCRAPEDQTAFVQVRGDLESLWFAVLGLVVGGLLGGRLHSRVTR